MQINHYSTQSGEVPDMSEQIIHKLDKPTGGKTMSV